MKKTFFGVLAMSMLLLSACGSSKNVEKIETGKNLEGERVRTENRAVRGFEMADALSEDGSKIVKVPYVWFASEGVADRKQVAIELAQGEAYATISRVMQNAVLSESERANLVNNGVVQQALTQHWKQVATSVLQGCSPFGDVEVQYNERNKMYTVWAKVAIRGDRYTKLLKEAGDFKPNGLNGQDLDDFIDVNHKIMDAVKPE